MFEIFSGDAASPFSKCRGVEIARDHGIVHDTAEGSDYRCLHPRPDNWATVLKSTIEQHTEYLGETPFALESCPNPLEEKSYVECTMFERVHDGVVARRL